VSPQHPAIKQLLARGLTRSRVTRHPAAPEGVLVHDHTGFVKKAYDSANMAVIWGPQPLPMFTTSDRSDSEPGGGCGGNGIAGRHEFVGTDVMAGSGGSDVTIDVAGDTG